MPRLWLSSLLLTAGVAAQDPENSIPNERVHAAIAFVNHGEKTPLLGGRDEVLTPEGAQQMRRQGNAFRARYLNSTAGLGDTTIEAIGSAPIDGIQTNAIDNDEVNVVSTEDPWVVGGATAFMQGLYPPSPESFNEAAGGDAMARNYADNASATVDYPFDGYQYARILTLTSDAKDSVSIQGTVACSKWMTETNTPLKSQDDMAKAYANTLDFYQGLFQKGALSGIVADNYPSLWNAHELYEYATYQYYHNETVFNELGDANETLSKLEENALLLASKMNSEPDDDADDKDAVYSIAGRTLAARIAAQLQRSIEWNSDRDKLSIIFGSYEPMLAFFSVSDLLNRENTMSGPFAHFPQPGAAMVLELVSDALENDDIKEPDINPDDLRIRFYYRENADDETEFQGFSLFGSGYGGNSIPYNSFYRSIQSKAIDSSAWCTVCAASSPWCPSVKTSDPSGPSSDGIYGKSEPLHPALAGLIGAVVFSMLSASALLAAYYFFGVRVVRTAAGRGGFKGDEKKMPDTDVAITGRGAAHERVGSWELRDPGEPGPQGGAGIVTKSWPRETTKALDGDGLSIMEVPPARVKENV